MSNSLPVYFGSFQIIFKRIKTVDHWIILLTRIVGAEGEHAEHLTTTTTTTTAQSFTYVYEVV